MAHLPVQCQNCGAKYKIPETFSGDAAKCKACGTMIDVAAARAGGGSADAAPMAAGGGTRRPRKSAAAAEATPGRSRRRDAEEQEPRGRRTATAGGRRRRGEDEDDQEEGGRRRYEPKKDNTAMIGIVSVVALAVVSLIAWMVMKGDGADTTKTTDKAGTPAAAKVDPKKADPPKEGDAAGGATEGNAGEAKDAVAKKPKKTTKKPTTKKPPAKKPEEVTKPEDVYSPKKELKPLPRPEGMDDEGEKTVNGLLDDLKEDGGLNSIRAPRKLADIGVKFIPIAVNRMLTLDYTKQADNLYAFKIAEAIRLVTEYTLALDPAKGGEFKLIDGHKNALLVRDHHILASRYWHSDAGMEKFRKAHPRKD